MAHWTSKPVDRKIVGVDITSLLLAERDKEWKEKIKKSINDIIAHYQRCMPNDGTGNPYPTIDITTVIEHLKIIKKELLGEGK